MCCRHMFEAFREYRRAGRFTDDVGHLVGDKFAALGVLKHCPVCAPVCAKSAEGAEGKCRHCWYAC